MSLSNRKAESHLADRRTPIHILTGFLGSGKTTLLRHLLADRDLADTAVIINEFGEVGLDHLLVREVAEDVVLLSSGCLCCSVRDDLVSTLAELNALMRTGEIPTFARVVVETTGLADPAPIMQVILSEQRLTPFFQLGQVITTVDAVNGEPTLIGHREARQQLANADRVIVTKTDLVDESNCTALIDKLTEMNPSAALLRSCKAQLPASKILEEADAQWHYPRGSSADSHEHHAHHAHGHDQAIKTFTVQLDHPVEWTAFVDWLELLLASRGDSILRVKGLLAVKNDDHPVVVQGVQHVLYPVERLPRWPDESARPGWIVFIARDLTLRAIENSLRSVYEHSFT
jgi:G3E family GTPase